MFTEAIDICVLWQCSQCGGNTRLIFANIGPTTYFVHASLSSKVVEVVLWYNFHASTGQNTESYCQVLKVSGKNALHR